MKALCLFIVIILLAGCSSQITGRVVETPVKIGVMAPLTGVAANLGENMLRGINLAINDSEDYELIIEDDQCNSRSGVNVAKKLIEMDNVDVIIGSICTVAVLPSAPLVEVAKVPRVTSGLAVQKVANAGDYHFTFIPEIKHQVKATINYAKKQNYSSIAILSVNDELGREMMSELKNSLDNINLTGEEYFEKTESDFKVYFAKVIVDNPDAIYLMGYTPNYINLVKQAKELGVKVPLLGWSLYQYPEVIQSLGEDASMVVYSYPEDPRELNAKMRFKEQFQDRYGVEPDIYAANAYDSYMIVKSALDKCKKNRECIKQELYSLNNYEGVNGFITVDDRGVCIREEVAMKTVRNGTFVLL
jgi:branched-chain amino acid transport system substrate-binding protein